MLNLYGIAAAGSEIVTKTPPSYTGVVLAALLALCTTMLFFLLTGERDRRKNEGLIKERNDQQMAAVNQSLALLLDKQGSTDRDMTDAQQGIAALRTQQSSYDTSLALLKQAIEMHITTSEADRVSLHRELDSVREGFRNHPQPADRRGTPRDTH